MSCPITPAINVGCHPPALCALQPPAVEAQKQQEQPPSPAPEPVPEPEQPQPEPQREEQQAEGVELGMGAGLRQRDVMDLIKVRSLLGAPTTHVHCRAPSMLMGAAFTPSQITCSSFTALAWHVTRDD